jgi:fructokinase
MTQRPSVVAIGEVLWDLFPTGPRFGGAPANFVCSVAELAGDRIDVSMVSGVGRDELGTKAIESLRAHGVDASHVVAVEKATGQVKVALDAKGQPTYEIATDVAWDHIPWSDALQQLASLADAVCFGTLAQRSNASRETVLQFVRATHDGCLRVLDINLRQRFWSKDVVVESLELANVLKLNDAELPVLADMLGFSGTTDDVLRQLTEEFPLELVALTRGAEGSLLLSVSGERSDLPGEPITVSDTVGAGDAFTAALVVGLLNGLPLATINAWGNRVAAFVASQSGATPNFPEALRRPE